MREFIRFTLLNSNTDTDPEYIIIKVSDIISVRPRNAGGAYVAQRHVDLPWTVAENFEIIATQLGVAPVRLGAQSPFSSSRSPSALD